MLNKVLDFLLSLVFIIFGFYIGAILLTNISNSIILMGGSAAQSHNYLNQFNWGILIMLFAAFLVLLGWAYKRTHDTGRR